MRIYNMLTMAAAGLALLVPGAVGQNTEPFYHAFQAAPPGSTSFLGVGIQEVSPERAKALQLPEEEGVEITRVDQNSPAASAGLMAGDVVIRYNGQQVEGMEQFARLVRETPVGRDVKLLIVRSGMTQTITAKIGSHPGGPIAVSPFAGGQPPAALPDLRELQRALPARGAVLGIQAEPIGDQLAEYFGVKGGALVRSVLKNSAADKAGIKAGDVITRVGSANVTSAADIAAQLRAQHGSSVSVTLTRNHREMTVNVPVEGQQAGERF